MITTTATGGLRGGAPRVRKGGKREDMRNDVHTSVGLGGHEDPGGKEEEEEQACCGATWFAPGSSGELSLPFEFPVL